jgi:peptide/nickel transport system ATP-binding protein
MTNLLDIVGLNIRFTGARTVYAVNDLSLALGKSGCWGCSAKPGRARVPPCAR